MKKITLLTALFIVAFSGIYAQTRYGGAVPNNGVTNIAPNANIELFFFDGSLTNSSVNASNIVIRGSFTGRISGSFSSFNTSTFRVTFNPTNDFKPGEIITIEVTDRVRSSTNSPILNPGFSSFTVATSLQQPAGTTFFSRTIDSPDGVTKPFAADIDKDGLIDIVAAAFTEGSISWYKNSGGSELTFTKNTIFTGAPNSVSMSNIDDVNRDGFLDFFAAVNGNLILFQHNGNLSNPSFTQIAVGTASGVNSLKTIDLNKDGDTDLVVASSSKLSWFDNINNTSFTERVIISSQASQIAMADINNDGDVDITYSTVSPSTLLSEVFLLQSNGAATPTFTSTQLASGILVVRFLDISDINNDGILDIVAHSSGAPVIRYFRNNVTSFTQVTIFNDNSFLNIQKPDIADIDGDGDLDAISGNFSNGRVALFTNNGAGSFTSNFNIGSVRNPNEVITADLDNDGDLDLITSSFSGDNLSWMSTNSPPISLVSFTPTANTINTPLGANIILSFSGVTNPSFVSATNIKIHGSQTGIISGAFSGGGTNNVTFNPTNNFKPGELITVSVTGGLGIVNPTVFTFTTTVSPTSPGEFVDGQDVITTTADGARSVFSADLDGDGDLDVLSASQNDVKIAWHQNDGAGNFGAEQIISNLVDSAQSVFAADIDGDGDIDVLSASQNDDKIAWYENDGAGNFGVQQIITTLADSARSVYAADLDGDGDLDVLSASAIDDKIAWYQNDGAGNFGPQQTISVLADGAFSVYAADLDGDGDFDVLSASNLGDKISWYKNDGSGNFGVEQIISTLTDGARSIYAADLDGDGDMDVLSASQTDNKLAWYQNDGSGNFGAQQIISTSANGATSVYAADIDGDGDLDVLSANFVGSSLSLHSNDGNGNFGVEQIISSSVSGPTAVYTTDIDGDGDLDVLSASNFDDKIAWYENTNSTLSLEDFTQEQGFKLFPNPVQNLLNISISNSLQIESFEIYNLNGQLLSSGKALPQNGIEVSNLASGLYLLKLQTNKGARTEKFIKQ